MKTVRMLSAMLALWLLLLGSDFGWLCSKFC